MEQIEKRECFASTPSVHSLAFRSLPEKIFFFLVEQSDTSGAQQQELNSGITYWTIVAARIIFCPYYILDFTNIELKLIHPTLRYPPFLLRKIIMTEYGTDHYYSSKINIIFEYLLFLLVSTSVPKEWITEWLVMVRYWQSILFIQSRSAIHPQNWCKISKIAWNG